MVTVSMPIPGRIEVNGLNIHAFILSNEGVSEVLTVIKFNESKNLITESNRSVNIDGRIISVTKITDSVVILNFEYLFDIADVKISDLEEGAGEDDLMLELFEISTTLKSDSKLLSAYLRQKKILEDGRKEYGDSSECALNSDN